MAKNTKNLIQYNESVSADQRRANASKAGIASGEARRKRRQMKDLLSDFMTATVTEQELIDILRENNLPCNQEAAICFAVVKKAQHGDVESARFIRDTLGEKPREDVSVTSVLDVPMDVLDLKSLSDDELRALVAKKCSYLE